jgi:hypothetical protein
VTFGIDIKHLIQDNHGQPLQEAALRHALGELFAAQRLAVVDLATSTPLQGKTGSVLANAAGRI